MKIHENLNIRDSKIKGIVVIKDSSGKIILKKENMIVESGREFIRDKFAANANIGDFSTGYSGTYLNYSLSHIGFGSSDVVSQFNMTSLIAENVSLLPRAILNNSNVEKGTTDVFLKFKASVDRTNENLGYTLREIGLYMSLELSFVLFSRVVFDPIPIAAGEKYEVEYYIYF